MMINFIAYSPLVSLLSISLLYLLKFHTRSAMAIRIYASILLFPSLISSMYLVRLTQRDSTVIASLLKTPFISTAINIQADRLNSIILLSLLLLMTILLFALPKKKLIENLSTAAFSLFWMVLISLISDQIIKLITFSIGTVLITFTILIDEYSRKNIKQLTSDFIIQRASDTLAFISLTFIKYNNGSFFIENYNEQFSAQTASRILYFFAIALRVFCVIGLRTNQPVDLDILFRNYVIKKIYTGIGAIILLQLISPLIMMQDSLTMLLFTPVALLFLLISSFKLIFKYNESTINDHIYNLLLSSSLTTICIGHHLVASLIISCILVIYPSLLLLELVKANKNSFISLPPKAIRPTLAPSFLTQIFLHLPLRASYLSAKLFINFLSPIYSGFLLYRLPQIILSIFQFPLRFLHNGNIQRSMLFVSIMVVSYIYWWG